MNTVLFLLAILASQEGSQKPTLYVLVGDDIYSKNVQAQLTRDWTKTNKKLSKGEAYACGSYQYRLNNIKHHYDIKFIHYSELEDIRAPHIKRPMFKSSRYAVYENIPKVYLREYDGALTFFELVVEDSLFDKKRQEVSRFNKWMVEKNEADRERIDNRYKRWLNKKYPKGIKYSNETRQWVDVATDMTIDRHPIVTDWSNGNYTFEVPQIKIDGVDDNDYFFHYNNRIIKLIKRPYILTDEELGRLLTRLSLVLLK